MMRTVIAPTREQIDGILDRLHAFKGGSVGYAIGVASPQFDPLPAFFFGNVLDYRGNPMPLDADVRFELASISKVFTAALLARYAVHDPKLLAKSVTAYAPPGLAPLPSSYDVIELLNLANYTSGLPADDSDVGIDVPAYLPQPYTTRSMYAFLHDGNVPVSGTGTTFTYSNLAPALLGNALPVAAGSDLDFPALLAREITSPLGMTATVPFVDISFTELPQPMSGGVAVTIHILFAMCGHPKVWNIQLWP